jgi:hypothetical protein
MAYIDYDGEWKYDDESVDLPESFETDPEVYEIDPDVMALADDIGE